MGKYANHEEFGVNTPTNYREDSTSLSYLGGMTIIALPGMRPKVSRGRRFEERTDWKALACWHHNYDVAMFGGSDIEDRDLTSGQISLERKLNGIKRVPGRK